MLAWACLSALGVACQCGLLWHLKKTGRRLHPALKAAVDSFEHGKTADERRLAQAQKRLNQIAENELSEADDHESLYLDMRSKSMTVSE